MRKFFIQLSWSILLYLHLDSSTQSHLGKQEVLASNSTTLGSNATGGKDASVTHAAEIEGQGQFTASATDPSVTSKVLDLRATHSSELPKQLPGFSADYARAPPRPVSKRTTIPLDNRGREMWDSAIQTFRRGNPLHECEDGCQYRNRSSEVFFFEMEDVTGADDEEDMDLFDEFSGESLDEIGAEMNPTSDCWKEIDEATPGKFFNEFTLEDLHGRQINCKQASMMGGSPSAGGFITGFVTSWKSFKLTYGCCRIAGGPGNGGDLCESNSVQKQIGTDIDGARVSMKSISNEDVSCTAGASSDFDDMMQGGRSTTGKLLTYLEGVLTGEIGDEGDRVDDDHASQRFEYAAVNEYDDGFVASVNEREWRFTDTSGNDVKAYVYGWGSWTAGKGFKAPGSTRGAYIRIYGYKFGTPIKYYIYSKTGVRSSAVAGLSCDITINGVDYVYETTSSNSGLAIEGITWVDNGARGVFIKHRSDDGNMWLTGIHVEEVKKVYWTWSYECCTTNDASTEVGDMCVDKETREREAKEMKRQVNFWFQSDKNKDGLSKDMIKCPFSMGISNWNFMCDFTLDTDGYTFKFSVDVRFNNWDAENYPYIIKTSTSAFHFHGLGPAYGGNKGKLGFYMITRDNVGSHGRGGGDVTTSAKLTQGTWYRVTVEKTAEKLCIQLNSATPSCATRTVVASKFQIKNIGDLSWVQSSTIDAKNFKDEASTNTEGCASHHEYTCCAIMSTPKTFDQSNVQNCEWSGDPHFNTFDGTKLDTTKGGANVYWIVKSDLVEIQSYYQGANSNGNMLTRGTVIGGRWLNGEKIHIRKDIQYFKDGKTVYTTGSDTNILEFKNYKFTWAGWGSFGPKAHQKVEWNYPGAVYASFTINFPYKVQYQINTYEYYFNNYLKMGLVEGMDGECGNFNKHPDDGRSRLEYNPLYLVAGSQNLFFIAGGYSQGAPFVATPAASFPVADCTGTPRAQFEAECDLIFAGSNMKTFKDLCVQDRCFAASNPDLAMGSEDAADDESGMDAFMEGRVWETYSDQSAISMSSFLQEDGSEEETNENSACAESLKLARIKNAAENRAALEALKTITGVSQYVFLGGSCSADGKTWKWNDGTDVCGFTKWGYGQSGCEAGKQHLCMDSTTGLWYGCDPSEARNFICEQEKLYMARGTAAPVAARAACGMPGLQLYMPKSEAETTAMIEAIGSAEPGKDMYHFIGGSFNHAKGIWMWDDETEICGYTNWASGQPKITRNEGVWLCAKPSTGKWLVCQTFTEERPIICETKPLGRQCPESLIASDDPEMILSQPPKKGAALFRDFCFYLGRRGKSCTETCATALDNGYCSSKGLVSAARSIESCSMAIASFGRLSWTHQEKDNTKRNGCTLIDDGNNQILWVKLENKAPTVDEPWPLPGSPTCDEVPAANQHRICACEPFDPAKDSFEDHTFEEYDRVRVKFTGYDGNCRVYLKQADTMVIKLSFNPANSKTFIGTFSNEGTWVRDDAVAGFPLGAESDPFKFDIKLLPDKWQFYINGVHHDEYDYPRYPEQNKPSRVTNWANCKTNDESDPVLFPPEDGTVGFPVSESSSNTCIEHVSTETLMKVVTIQFAVMLTDSTGKHCVRCEWVPLAEGNNLYFEGNKLVLYTPLNNPKKVTFNYEFTPNEARNVQVVYDSDLLVADLMINLNQEDRHEYVESNPLDFGPAHVGCHMGDQEQMEGWIQHFQMIEAIPDNRRPFGDCRGFLCNPGTSNLPNPTQIECTGTLCDPTLDEDQNLCCDPLPYCDPAYICPEGQTYLEHAADIMCESLTPQVDQNSHHCCANLGSCLLYTCIGNTILKVNPQDIICERPICQPTENSKCCDEVALCSTYACPEGWSVRGDAGILYCADRVCSSEDTDACCLKEGYCSSYKCPNGMMHKANADDMLCASQTCDGTDPTVCCVHQQSCAAYSCPTGHMLKSNALELQCHDLTCKQARFKDQCNPACTKEHPGKSPTTCIDPDGMITHLLTGFLAKGCPADDIDCLVHSVCGCKDLCADNVLCNTFVLTDQGCKLCTGGMDDGGQDVAGATTYEHSCVDELTGHCDDNCENPDKDNTAICCTSAAVCSEYTCPVAGYFLKTNPETIYCEDSECTVQDLNTCCLRKGYCDSYPCPTGSEHRPNAHNIECLDSDCTEASYHSCCAQLHTCDMYPCPKYDYVLKENAHMIACVHATCEGQDVSDCCQSKASCAVHQCPFDTVHKLSANNLYCLEATCGPLDDDTCCGVPGRCTLYDCPPDWLMKTNAPDIPCPGFDCEDASDELCCAPEGTCAAHVCPSSMIPKEEWVGGSHIYCLGWKCTDADNDRCCHERASCLTFMAQPKWVRRPDAINFFCKNTTCTQEDDRETCAYKEGTCASFMLCPDGKGLRPDAADILCSDTICAETDEDTCCADLARCESYGCPSGYVAKHPDETPFPCPGYQCDDADRDLCCSAQQLCNAWEPPTGYTLRHTAASIKCRNATCNEEDLETCAVPEGVCAAFTECGVGKTLRHDAEDIYCDDSKCEDTDPDKCCAPMGHCTTYKCHDDWVHADPVGEQNYSCAFEVCTDLDRSTCCVERATCTAFDCETGYTKKPLPEEILCAADQCTIEHDLGTCCFLAGKCPTLEACPLGMKLRHDAADIWCSDSNCDTTDINRCCVQQRSCLSFHCEENWVLKWDAEVRQCEKNQCADSDRDECCVPLAPCSTLDCETGWVLKEAPEPATSLRCQNATCEDDLDRNHCCAQEGRCSIYRCGDGTKLRSDAADIECQDETCSAESNDHCCADMRSCATYHCEAPWAMIPDRDEAEKLSCSGFRCGEQDRETCCILAAFCTGYECDTGFLTRVDAAETRCVSNPCDKTDHDTCCSMVGRCSVASCPAGFAVRDENAEILCSDSQCKDQDYHVCCVQKASCHEFDPRHATTNLSMTCPEFTHNLPDVDCELQHCVPSDVGICCYPNDLCTESYIPDTGWSMRGDAAYQRCGSKTCTLADKDRCSVMDGRCSTMMCVAGMVLRYDADDILCETPTCASTDEDLCCVLPNSCHSFDCESAGHGEYIKTTNPNVDDLFCDETGQCNIDNPNNIIRCCDMMESCTALEGQEPTGYTLRGDADQKRCAAKKCHSEFDRDTCLTVTGRCSQRKCDDGMILRHDSDDILCDDKECVTTDVNKCCVDEGVCGSLKCPAGYVLKAGAYLTPCAGQKCAEHPDRDRCCHAVATCASFDPLPSGYAIRPSASTILCSNVTCTQQDISTCADLEGRCTTLVCPASMELRGDADDRLCQTEICTQADESQCCALGHTCATMKCPEGWLLKHEAHEILCPGWDCLPESRDLCCEPLASCETYIPDTGFELVANANQLKCKGATCGSFDKELCSANPGTCTTMVCPTGQLLRHDAAEIMCSHFNCTDNDENRCCAPTGHCHTISCPSGYLHRPNPDTIECFHDWTCMLPVDRDICCEQKALCTDLQDDVPAGYVLRGDSFDTHCAGAQCDVWWDADACLTLTGRCAQYQCAGDTTLRYDASDILCLDALCTDSNQARCCVETGTCASMDCGKGFFHWPGREEDSCLGFQCVESDRERCCKEQQICSTWMCSETGYVLRPDANMLYCKGDQCSSEDLDLCCAQEGRCAMFRCTSPEVLRHDADEILCDDTSCSATPESTCCASVGKCDSLACPEGYLHKEFAHMIDCASGASGSWVCELEMDRDVCCDKRATCKTMETSNLLPWGWTSKLLPDQILCAGLLCDENVDLSTCAVETGACTSLTCPEEYSLRGDAADILCIDEWCSTDDYDKCCALDRSCLTMVCPEDYVHRPGANETLCEAFTCVESDLPRCCEQKALCSTFAAPAGYDFKGLAGSIYCAGSQCNQKDLDTCTDIVGRCTLYKCIDTYMLRQDAADLMCTDRECADGDNLFRCCAPQGRCSTFDCPEGWKHIADANETQCEKFRCTEEDKLKCCRKLASCDDFSLDLAGYTKKANASNLYCQDVHCIAGDRQSVDLETCADPEGMCPSMVCPQGTSQRMDAQDVWCKTTECTGADLADCCAEVGKCSSVTCPSTTLHVENANETECRSHRCTDVDLDFCCVQRAKCSTMSPPEGYELKEQKHTLRCAGLQCDTIMDLDTCANRLGFCTMATCPLPHYQHRSDASEIQCMDKTCDATNVDVCCAIAGGCLTMTCPSGYVWQPDAFQRTCENWKCTVEDDRDQCCAKRADCSTHLCPDQTVLRPEKNELLCTNITCTSPDDDVACCVNPGTCAMYDCGSDMKHKDNADELYCITAGCWYDNDEVCCLEDGKCNTYTCPEGYVYKWGYFDIHCRDEACHDVDRDTCCAVRARCSEMAAEPGWELKVNAAELLCANSTCTAAEDIETCLVRMGTCDSMTCPLGTQAKTDLNAAETYCDDPDCQTNIPKCCADEGHCNTYSCPSGYTMISNASEELCKKWMCDDQDKETCCEANARCTTFPIVNFTGYMLKLNKEELICSGVECTEADLDTCAMLEGRCTQMVCPSAEYTLRHDAAEILCDDQTCQNTPTEDCCAKVHECASYTCPSTHVAKPGSEHVGCRGNICCETDIETCCVRRAPCFEMLEPTGWVHRAEANKLLCHNATCTEEEDLNTCCQPVGSCLAFTCPEGFILREEASTLVCSDANCTDTDLTLCCGGLGKCGSYTCPSLYIQKPYSYGTPCESWICTYEHDRDTCCDQVAFCDTFVCPKTYVSKDGKETIPCHNTTCDDNVDRDTCCHRQGSCATVTCTKGLAPRADAANILCTDSECKDYDEAICCAELGMCNTYSCPSFYIMKPDADILSCRAWECASEDRDTCCDQVARCSTLACIEPNFMNKPTGANIPCKGTECNLADDEETCCTKTGHCPMLTCPEFHMHRPGAEDILCEDPECSDLTNFEICCAKTGGCDSFDCPEGYMLKDNASHIPCQALMCDPTAERDVCCQEKAYCSTHTCPELMVEKIDYASILCAGKACTEHDDTTCCATKGTCLAFKCPEGTLHRADASEILCGSYDCEENTDWEDCCAKVGTCDTFACPHGFMAFPTDNETNCKGWTCTTEDRDTCCQPLARCPTMICPANHVPLETWAEKFCASTVCTNETDAATCCAKEGSCATYNCTVGWIKKTNAAEIMCSDKDCTMTPLDRCCGLKGKCSSFSCPSGYLAKPDGSQIDCEAWKCTMDADRDLCCNPKARCSTYVCPTTMANFADDAERFCEAEQCGSYNDAFECCTSLGSCDTYDCPPMMMLRADASELYCSTETCDVGPATVCCQEVGLCSTFKCPEDFKKKPNDWNISCIGWTCSDQDRDVCCNELARCNTMVPPYEYALKPLAASINCADVECNEEHDLETCAELKGTCGLFACDEVGPPYQWANKYNAEHILCLDAECSDDSFELCCAREGSCLSGIDCGVDWEHQPNAENISCNEFVCSLAADKETCCWELGGCLEHVCPGNMSHRSTAEFRKCAHHNCGDEEEYDTAECCVENGWCPQYPCPDGYLHLVDASVRRCEDENCSTSNYDHCCAPAGKCASYYEQCPDNYVPRNGTEQDVCVGFICSVIDLDTCCEIRAPCTEYVCPNPGWKQARKPLLCAGPACDIGDLHTCCIEDGKCTSFICPETYTMKVNAKDLYCEDPFCNQTDVDVCCNENNRCPSLACDDSYTMVENGSAISCEVLKCTREFDHFKCCEPIAKCSEHVCPPKHLHKLDAPDRLCSSRVCIPGIDDAECCAEKGHCLTFNCRFAPDEHGHIPKKPLPYVHRPNVEDLVCADEDCSVGQDQCCAVEGHCLSYACDSGYVHKPTAYQLYCAGVSCTSVDRDMCCVERELCERYVCPEGYSHKPDVSVLLCKNFTCDQEDLRTCCNRDGWCDSMICPDGHVHRPNAHDIRCVDPSCDNSEFLPCCAPQGICLSLACPSGWVHELNASIFACKSWICTDADISECCEPREPCADYEEGCVGEFDLRSDAAEVLCASATCNEEDFDSCCVPDGTCATYVCTNGTSLKMDSDLILCDTPDCSTTRDEDCCDSLDSCAVYQCPNGWQPKYDPGRIICPGLKCMDSDKWLCCDKRAFCDTMVCPYKYSLKKAPELIMCRNHTCEIIDRDECCHHNDMCLSYQCPDGWVHMHNASFQVCDKGLNGEISCNETHPSRCCDLEGRCSTFHCPDLYVQRSDAHQIPCKIEVCDVFDDEDRCCKKVDFCNSFPCDVPGGRVHKAHSEKLPCPDDKCSDDACCSDAGKCITLPCPAGEAHKVGADELTCDDGACTATDFDQCCDLLSRCSTYHCPKGYRSKVNNESLSCDGWKCGVMDVDTCCDKLAECNTWDCIHDGFIPNSARLLDHCNDTICVEEDEWYCCMPGYHCDSCQCPIYWTHVPDAEDIICDGINCVDSPFTLCCGEKARCDEMECPYSEGWVPWLNGEPRNKTHCEGMVCTIDDDEECCLRREECREDRCPNGWALRQEEGLLCHNFSCHAETDKDTCCEERMPCTLHTCPDGMAWRENIKEYNTLCKFGNCVSSGDANAPSADDAVCCEQEVLGKCAHPDFTCPDGYIFKPDISDTPCHLHRCDAKYDKMICCDARAMCTSMKCPAGMEPKRNERKQIDRTIMCEGKECVDSDTPACCIEESEVDEEDKVNKEGETGTTTTEETTTTGEVDEEQDEFQSYACRVHGYPLAAVLHVSLLGVALRSVASAFAPDRSIGW